MSYHFILKSHILKYPFFQSTGNFRPLLLELMEELIELADCYSLHESALLWHETVPLSLCTFNESKSVVGFRNLGLLFRFLNLLILAILWSF